MTKKLDLSDEQSAQMLQLMQAIDLERDALNEQIRQQMKPELCELQLRAEADIESILNESQLAEFTAAQDERGRKRSRNNRPGPHDVDCSEFE